MKKKTYSVPDMQLTAMQTVGMLADSKSPFQFNGSGGGKITTSNEDAEGEAM